MFSPTAPRVGPLRWGLVLPALAGLVFISCTQGQQTPKLRRLPARIDPQLTARENLAHLAAAEIASSRLPPLQVPTPPGVDPQVLIERNASDAAATMTLDSALKTIDKEFFSGSDVFSKIPSVDAAARSQALRHYLKGRDAALNDRSLVAITEFRQAAELDPYDPNILRELARIYLHPRENKRRRAVSIYRRLLQVRPDDPEALFELGFAAANRLAHAEAAAYLAQPRLAGRTFDHEPGAPYVADFILLESLRKLGYDRAAIELGRKVILTPDSIDRPTVHVRRIASIYRQRGDIWRAIGDGHCRLGEYAPALDAYQQSAALPIADPAALDLRVIYANLRLGRIFSAQRAVLATLGGDNSPATQRSVRLCSFLAQHVDQTQLLAEAVAQRYRENLDDPFLARAAAALMGPTEAVELLRQFLDRRPDDLAVLGQLLRWLVQEDPQLAVALTANLCAAHPELSGTYVLQLGVAAPRPTDLFEFVRRMPASPEAAVVESRLLAYLRGFGQAWTVCETAIVSWPHDQALLLLQLALAADLREPQLLDRVIRAIARYDDVTTWRARAQARRALNQTESALDAAEAALALAPQDVKVLTELARCSAAHAATIEDVGDQRGYMQDALARAERAIEIELDHLDAYATLLGFYDEAGLLRNSQLYENTINRLRAAAPDSRLLVQVLAQRAARQGRFEQAIERFLGLYDNDRTDTASMNLAVVSWIRQGKLDAALQWLDERLSERPGDPALLEQWAVLQLQNRKGDVAIERIESLLVQHPEHHAARRMLETLYRSAGDPDRALELSEQRLLSRPQGIHRELELSALYAAAGMSAAAVRHLQWIREKRDNATYDQLANAMAVAGRIDGAGELTLQWATYITQRFPDAPLQAYGSGLRALAKMGRLDDEFDALADRAVVSAPGASGSSLADTTIWQRLGQALVDAGHPGAAARALRARLRSDAALQPQALARLITFAITADAAVDQLGDSIDLLKSLALRGDLPKPAEVSDERALAEAFYTTSQVYATLGNQASAEQLLRLAVALFPNHAMVLNNLGYSRIDVGHDDAKTIQWIERAYELEPRDSNILDTIGWLRYKQGRFEDAGSARGAVSLIKEAMARDSQPSAEVLDHLGDAQWRSGDTDAATDAWLRAEQLLEAPSFRQRVLQNYQLVQIHPTQGWGLLVADPQELYHENFGLLLQRISVKLRDTGQGKAPQIAPTFAEMDEMKTSGESNDGRPQ